MLPPSECFDQPIEANYEHNRSLYASAPRTTSWSLTEGGLTLTVWRPRWFPPRLRCHSWTADELFGDRVITFSIVDAAGRLIAVGKLDEWRRNPIEEGNLANLADFRMAADLHSQAAYDALGVLFAGWPEDRCEDPFDFGNVVIFDRLRIEAASPAQSTAVWALINRMIAREFSAQKRASLMLFKAFPLAFEGGAASEDRATCECKQAALMRLYRRRLKAASMPEGRHRT